MTDRHIDGFFYGLFMDSDILSENQIVPERPRRAYVDDYALCIGQKATLVPRDGARAYGMIFALSYAELAKLYAAPGLEQYQPEAVIAHVMRGQAIPALCYNLCQAPGPDEANAEYATRLRAALGKLEFPADYIASVS